MRQLRQLKEAALHKLMWYITRGLLNHFQTEKERERERKRDRDQSTVVCWLVSLSVDLGGKEIKSLDLSHFWVFF